MRLMELYDCGCYQDGKCALTREIANCVYYDKCMNSEKPPKLVEFNLEAYISDNI